MKASCTLHLYRIEIEGTTLRQITCVDDTFERRPQESPSQYVRNQRAPERRQSDAPPIGQGQALTVRSIGCGRQAADGGVGIAERYHLNLRSRVRKCLVATYELPITNQFANSL